MTTKETNWPFPSSHPPKTAVPPINEAVEDAKASLAGAVAALDKGKLAQTPVELRDAVKLAYSCIRAAESAYLAKAGRTLIYDIAVEPQYTVRL